MKTKMTVFSDRVNQFQQVRSLPGRDLYCVKLLDFSKLWIADKDKNRIISKINSKEIFLEFYPRNPFVCESELMCGSFNTELIDDELFGYLTLEGHFKRQLSTLLKTEKQLPYVTFKGTWKYVESTIQILNDVTGFYVTNFKQRNY